MGSRRGNSEGSFYQRPDGRWEGKLRYTDARGESHRVSGYGPTRKAAKESLDKKLDRIREGLAVTDSKSPLAAVAAKWRTTTLPASDRRQATKDLYENRCRLHIEQGYLADIPMARLTPSDVEKWIVESLESGVAQSSLRTDYAVLRSILDTAVRDGVVAKNVAALVDRPSVARKEALHLAPEQVHLLLEKIAESRHALPIILAASSGMRRGEVLALRWKDVNLVKREVTVAGTMSGSGRKLRREPAPKTHTSYRTLTVSEALAADLERRLTQQVAERKAAPGNWDDDGIGYVFTTELGRPIDPRNLLRTLQTAAVRLDLPKGVGLHTLRHSAATTLLESGVHIKLVSAILGHSDTSITADIYGHSSDGAQRAALDALHASVTGDRHLRVVPGDAVG